MAFIEWTPELSVGVAQFDEQHKKLVALINGLHDAMAARQAQGALGPLFDELVRYTVEHFSAEEKLMQQHNYVGLVAHQGEHKALTKQALELQEKFRQGNISLSIEVLSFLKSWLANHIKGTDKRYGGFFNAKGIR